LHDAIVKPGLCGNDFSDYGQGHAESCQKQHYKVIKDGLVQGCRMKIWWFIN